MQTVTKGTNKPAFRVIFKDAKQRQAFKALCVAKNITMNEAALTLIAEFLNRK